MSSASTLVRDARTRARMSVREFASRAGVQPSTVTRVEKGQMNPTVTMLERLLAAAGVDLQLQATAKPAHAAVDGPTLAAVQQSAGTIRRIVERHGGGNVRVVGSVARGEAGPDSDVDLLIDAAAGTSLFDVAEMEHELGDALGWKVDVLTSGMLHGHMASVATEAVTL